MSARRKTLYEERTAAFKRGYQAALADVLDCLDQDDSSRAREWIADNLAPHFFRSDGAGRCSICHTNERGHLLAMDERSVI